MLPVSKALTVLEMVKLSNTGWNGLPGVKTKVWLQQSYSRFTSHKSRDCGYPKYIDTYFQKYSENLCTLVDLKNLYAVPTIERA